MSCNCCGPPKETIGPTPIEAPMPTETHFFDDRTSRCGEPSDVAPITSNRSVDPECTDDCCDNDPRTKHVPVETSRAIALEETNDDCCKDGCCSGGEKRVEPAIDDVPNINSDCRADCCDSGAELRTLKIYDNMSPPCCQGKPAPCCDVSCLDRLALRECSVDCCDGESDQLKSSSVNFQTSTGSHKAAGKKACGRHQRSTRDRYGATLQALGCICRALLARGLESCCDTRQLSSIDGKRCSKKSSRSSIRSSVDSCCATGACAVPTSKPAIRSRLKCSGRGCGKEVRETTYSVESDDASDLQPIKTFCVDACCSFDKAPSPAIDKLKAVAAPESCTDAACCSSKKPMIKPTLKKKASTPGVDDLERQFAGTEHIVLSISGMTCTGCETKLNRTLAGVPAVANLKTSLILSRAEFDLDLGVTSVEDIIKHLDRTTEFKSEAIVSHGSSVFILVEEDPSQFIDHEWPAGVMDMAVVDGQVVRVTFDTAVVGARDLIEKGWDQPQKLAPPRPDSSLDAGSKHVRQLGFLTLLSALLTVPVLVLAWAPLPQREVAYSSASLALATIVQVAIAGPFYPKAIKALIFSRVIEMDLLIVLSTSAAYIFSVVAFVFLITGNPLETEQFFETSTLLVTLIMVGRYLAALARQKAVESISIRSLQASTATIVTGGDGSEKKIDVRLLQYGDIFKVIPDTSIPTDGCVISGSSEVDESLITGEAYPVEKSSKSSVIAGSINGPGTLIVRLTRLPGENTINTIAAMVDEAKLSKPKMQGLADRVASYFVPAVVALAIITFCIWVAVGVAVRKQSGSDAIVKAITYAITVLIVSCPCAIGLAVPMVIVIASGVAAKRGVVFKTADAIEVAYKASHVVFDKTGTLTKGELSVSDTWYARSDNDDSLSLLLGLVGDIRHPVSVAVAAHLKATGVSAATVPEPRSIAGKGVEATVGGKALRAGNSRWLNLATHPVVESTLENGCTVFCFVIDNSLEAVFGLEDSVRGDAGDTVAKLEQDGITVHMVSGDDDTAVQSAATALGIEATNVRSRCSPSDKQAYIQRLLGSHAANETKPVVVFCGDGTNDAVALAQATVGVHMNEGTDVAKSAADVVLMRPDLSGILSMITISRHAVHRVKFNFAWSFVYNLFAVLLAAGAFVRATIPPEFAGLGELVSVLPVIAAAVLLRWSRD